MDREELIFQFIFISFLLLFLKLFPYLNLQRVMDYFVAYENYLE